MNNVRYLSRNSGKQLEKNMEGGLSQRVCMGVAGCQDTFYGSLIAGLETVQGLQAMYSDSRTQGVEPGPG
jgi:hypothetical protein